MRSRFSLTVSIVSRGTGNARPDTLCDGGYVITTGPAWSGETTLVASQVGTAVVTVLSTVGAGNGHASAVALASQLVAALRGRA